MSTSSERILASAGSALQRAWPLFDVAHARALETAQPAHGCASLMQTAGLALARLALALAPHARVIWVACGPGNNGGDGLEAAAHLQRWGKQVIASLVHDPAHSPPDARLAWAAAKTAGVTFSNTPPAAFDLCLDALFGIGSLRPLTGDYARWASHMNASQAPTLAVDVPSGLNADTGALSALHVVANYTLSLLTLKPGLFTGGGRDACGEIWFNNLGVTSAGEPQAWLSGPGTEPPRLHASHKGSYGDVCVVGGAEGMAGAALLAARSALHAGAGRVFVCPLGASDLALDTQLPELMFRCFDSLDWSDMTLVAGCGGSDAIAQHLPAILHGAKRLVLDADALNHIASNPALQHQMTLRPAGSTVMTPHPLEAARLLACAAPEVQEDRLSAAQTLAQRYQCVVVLKGSGTIIAAPGQVPNINPTGNAKLASAGTGDVLAGLLGARLAGGLAAQEAAASSAYQHGLAAHNWPGAVLSASVLCQWSQAA